MINIEKKILNIIKCYKNIIIFRHINPDLDAIGAQNGLFEILQKNFPYKKIFKVGKILKEFKFLNYIKKKVKIKKKEEILAIVLDTANFLRIDGKKFLNYCNKIIKIDHHFNNEAYGDINWVDTKFNSCSEMIIKFYIKNLNILKINNNIAYKLYSGIIGDTGRFLYFKKNSYNTFKFVCELFKYKFNILELYKKTEYISIKKIKFIIYILNNLKIDKFKIVRIVLKNDIIKKFKLTKFDINKMIYFLNFFKEILILMFFVQQKNNEFKLHLRSKGPFVDKISRKYNGGGHCLASSAIIKNLFEMNSIYKDIKISLLESCKKKYENI